MLVSKRSSLLTKSRVRKTCLLPALNRRPSSTLELRSYQEACLAACLEALESGVRRVGISLPTGSGKTAVFTTLLSRLETMHHQQPNSSLVIVNSVELALQTASLARRIRPDWKVEIEQGAQNHASGTANLTVATYQTLLRTQRLKKFNPEGIRAIVVDEAHHAAAPSYRRILSHFNSKVLPPELEPTPESATLEKSSSRQHQAPSKRDVPIFGFSATFSRHDGLALGSVFERIVYHRDFLQMIKEKWLCNVCFTTVHANINLKDVTISTRTGDFNATSLAHVINTETVNKIIVQAWMEKAYDRKSTLVFCVNLSHVRDLTNTFRLMGHDARYLHSGTPAAERKQLLESFRQGEYPVLVNCAILTEGADIPNIDCIIVARPTRSRNVFAQMIGRGMRLSRETGKQDCRIIDFVDALGRMHGVVSMPTLYGLNPSEIIDNIAAEVLEERSGSTTCRDLIASGQGNTTDIIPDPRSVTFVDYDNPFVLENNGEGTPPHISKLSRNAWVGCGGDIYVLECLGRGHIRIEPFQREAGDGQMYSAHFAPAMTLKFKIAANFTPFQHKRHVLHAETLSGAIRGCDTYVSRTVLQGPMAAGLLRSAKWRREPATVSQKNWISKRWGMRPTSIGMGDNHDFSERIELLTKGKAANIITRLKHGAMARYTSQLKARNQVEAAEVKERKRQAREHVQVGPL